MARTNGGTYLSTEPRLMRLELLLGLGTDSSFREFSTWYRLKERIELAGHEYNAELPLCFTNAYRDTSNRWLAEVN